jgi:hypothetical protein
MTEKTSKEFYELLFNDDEYTCFAVSPYDTKTYEVSEGNYDRAQFFSINPLRKNSTRAGKNVKRYRNLMFEIDNLPLKEQASKIKASGLPYSTSVFSGNKSIHWIISLKQDLVDDIEYKAIWLAIEATLAKYDIEVDNMTKDPARLSRCPNAIRRDNEKKQSLIEIHGKVDVESVKQWLSRNDVDWQDYLPKQEYNSSGLVEVSDVEDQLKIDWIKKYFMKDDEYAEGKRHNYQVKMAYLLLRTGMTSQAIDSYFRQEFGEISTGIKTVSSLDMATLGESIYVPSKEERVAYAKKREAEERAKELQSRVNNKFIDNVTADIIEENIDRYIRVGTKYFKTDPTTNDLLDWDKGTFQDDYGRGTLPPRIYDAFTYKPDYVSEEFPADLMDGRYRNRFRRPAYEITEGDWNTIRAALKHAFKDQYELALQMCSVMLKWPETRLPILILLGEEGVGKSAIIKIFQYLLGIKNTKSIKSKQFESEFDGFLMDTQLLVIEEAGAWKDPTGVADEFKRLATEVGMIEINPKYGKQTEYPWFGWIMCTSNDLSPVRMEGSATRFWVVEMTPIEHKVENYYDKIQAEMGHFAHYLLNEVEVEHPSRRSARLYFEPEEYHTAAKDFVKDYNKGDLYEKLLDVFNDFFSKFDDHDVLYFDLKTLIKKVNSDKEKYSATELKEAIAKHFGVKSKTNNLLRPNGLDYQQGIDPSQYEIPEKKTQWYQVRRDLIVKEDPLVEQMNDIFNL